ERDGHAVPPRAERRRRPARVCQLLVVLRRRLERQVGTPSPLPEPPSCPGTFGAPSAQRSAPEADFWRVGKINSHTRAEPLLTATSGLSGGPVMPAKRIIPCLDVDAGRVVKGVRFVDLKDAGDPAELAAAYDRAGADEIVFLDITASHEERRT